MLSIGKCHELSGLAGSPLVNESARTPSLHEPRVLWVKRHVRLSLVDREKPTAPRSLSFGLRTRRSETTPAGNSIVAPRWRRVGLLRHAFSDYGCDRLDPLSELTRRSSTRAGQRARALAAAHANPRAEEETLELVVGDKGRIGHESGWNLCISGLAGRRATGRPYRLFLKGKTEGSSRAYYRYAN
jgi:hypothetical protein